MNSNKRDDDLTCTHPKEGKSFLSNKFLNPESQILLSASQCQTQPHLQYSYPFSSHFWQQPTRHMS
uniref:Uncharacterized protein n=1 Tax=Rhizophora mucronata TaxID=61149 RepID=A0A2P2M6K7_RHIMU